MYGQGPFIPMPDMTKRHQQQPQQTQVYRRPDEEEEEAEWYEGIPILGSVIGLGDDIFGDDEKKGKRDSVGSIARGAGDIAAMIMGLV